MSGGKPWLTLFFWKPTHLCARTVHYLTKFHLRSEAIKLHKWFKFDFGGFNNGNEFYATTAKTALTCLAENVQQKQLSEMKVEKKPRLKWTNHKQFSLWTERPTWMWLMLKWALENKDVLQIRLRNNIDTKIQSRI